MLSELPYGSRTPPTQADSQPALPILWATRPSEAPTELQAPREALLGPLRFIAALVALYGLQGRVTTSMSTTAVSLGSSDQSEPRQAVREPMFAERTCPRPKPQRHVWRSVGVGTSATKVRHRTRIDIRLSGSKVPRAQTAELPAFFLSLTAALAERTSPHPGKRLRGRLRGFGDDAIKLLELIRPNITESVALQPLLLLRATPVQEETSSDLRALSP